MGEKQENNMPPQTSANIFWAEKPAFILTVLLSVLGWSAVYLVESITNLPTVEYDIKITKESDSKNIKVTLYNLSKKIKLTNLKFGLSTRVINPGTFGNEKVIDTPPAFSNFTSKVSGDNAGTYFTIPQLFPMSEISMQAKYTGKDIPEFRLISSKESVLLVESSIGTFITKHIFTFISLVVAFVLVGLIYIAFNIKK